jgi:hypothetical protein
MTSSHLRRIDPINRWIKDCGMLFTRAQVRHAATVVFPVDFDGGEHVYRVHPINVQLVTDPVIMPAKEEHGCGSGSESIDNHEPRDILRCHVERRDQSFSIGSIISCLYFTAFNVS